MVSALQSIVCLKIYILADNKLLLDEVFLISRTIKVSVRVISRIRSLSMRLIALTETLIVLDIKKPNLIIVLLYIEQKN